MNAANLNLTIKAQSFDMFNYWFSFINSWTETSISELGIFSLNKM